MFHTTIKMPAPSRGEDEEEQEFLRQEREKDERERIAREEREKAFAPPPPLVDFIDAQAFKDRIVVRPLWPPYRSVNRLVLALIAVDDAPDLPRDLSLKPEEIYLDPGAPELGAVKTPTIVLGECRIATFDEGGFLKERYSPRDRYSAVEAAKLTRLFRAPQLIEEAHLAELAEKERERRIEVEERAVFIKKAEAEKEEEERRTNPIYRIAALEKQIERLTAAQNGPNPG